MPDHYFHLFAHEDQLLRKLTSYQLAINITIHTFKRFKRIKPFNDPIPKITRMPNLITVLEMLKDRIIEIIMRIGYKAYSCQIISIFKCKFTFTNITNAISPQLHL